MSNPFPKAIRAPSHLERVIRLVKRMLAVVAALDSAEAMTLRGKRRILSTQLHAVHQENIGVTRIFDCPQQRNRAQPGSQTERLTG